VKDLGLLRGWQGIGVISGSCQSGNGYLDSVSSTVSVPHLVGGLELVPTVVRSDEGPANVSGRAISGSGRVTTPGFAECISARTTTSDRPARN